MNCFSSEFNLSDISLIVKKTSRTEEVVTLSADMVDEADLNKLRTTGNHQIKVKYLDAEATLNVTIRADETEFRVHDNYIQWKYKFETAWRNLISLDDLKGAKGDPGENGTTPTVEISEDGYWVINGEKTNVKAKVEEVVKETHTVIYVLKGGELPEGEESVQVEEGAHVPLPVPVREGFKFVGWYDETGKKYEDYDVVNKDLTLYAYWVCVSEISEFLDRFTGDNLTLKFYSWVEDSTGIGQRSSFLMKKARQGNLINYFLSQDYFDLCYLTDDGEFYYAFPSGEFVFEFGIIPREYGKLISPYFNFNFTALRPLTLIEKGDGTYWGNLDREFVLLLFGEGTGLEEADWLSGDVTVDPVANKLTFRIYSGYPEEQKNIIVFLDDVGTTEVEVSYTILFDLLESQIEFFRRTLPDATIPVFDEFLSEAIQWLESINNTPEFLSWYTWFINHAQDFQADPYKDYVYERIEDLEDFVALYRETATDASLEAMEELLEEARAALLSAKPVQIPQLYEYYYQEMFEIRIIDPEKVALKNARSDAYDDIMDIFDEFADLILCYENPDLKGIRDRYLNLLEEATDIETIERIPDDFLEELQATDFVYHPAQLKMVIDRALWDLEEVYYELDPELQDLLAEDFEAAFARVSAVENPFRLNGIIDEIVEELLGKMREHYLAIINVMYEEYLFVVPEDRLDDLEELYEEALAGLEEADQPYAFILVIDQFSNDVFN